jgi:shikimate kinase
MNDPAGRITPIGEMSNEASGHLVLVGMTGAGKSSVGRQVADRLDCEWVDTDQLIEKSTGRTVRDIFAVDGEAAFRALETEALSAALESPKPSVISTGGGIVLSEGNRKLLREPQHRVVWLMADPSILLERLQHGMHRPLLDQDPEGTLARMWQQREALYREVADVIVSVDGRSIVDVTEAILR